MKEEAEDMILHAICGESAPSTWTIIWLSLWSDHLTSSLSAAPLNLEELKELLSLLGGVKGRVVLLYNNKC